MEYAGLLFFFAIGVLLAFVAHYMLNSAAGNRVAGIVIAFLLNFVGCGIAAYFVVTWWYGVVMNLGVHEAYRRFGEDSTKVATLGIFFVEVFLGYLAWHFFSRRFREKSVA